jgi:hypothetical protein
MLAVGQIVIALIPALNLHMNFTLGYVAFGSIFFAVLVLTYSLLLGMGNYAARSVKLHGCGLELGRLARKLYAMRTDPSVTDEDYKTAAQQYYDILEKHENHTKADYLVAHYEYYASGAALLQAEASGISAKSTWLEREWHLQKTRLEIFTHNIFQYWHYFFTTVLIWSWIYCLVR